MEPMREQVINKVIDETLLQQNNFCIALPKLFSLFRCTFTAVQLFALLHQAATVNHPA